MALNLSNLNRPFELPFPATDSKMTSSRASSSLCAISAGNRTQRGFLAKITLNTQEDMAVLVTLDRFEPNIGEVYQLQFDDGSVCEISVTNTTFCLISRVLRVTVIELNLEDHAHRLLEIDDRLKLTGNFTGKTEIINVFLEVGQYDLISPWGIRVTHSQSTTKPGEPVLGSNGRVVAVNLDETSSVLMFQIVGAIQRCFELGRTARMIDIELDPLPEDKQRNLRDIGLEPVPGKPLFFTSRANDERTELTFMRTIMGWFWAPKASDSSIDGPGWTPIWEGYQMKAIGASYDGAKPHSSNWPKIKELAKSRGYYL